MAFERPPPICVYICVLLQIVDPLPCVMTKGEVLSSALITSNACSGEVVRQIVVLDRFFCTVVNLVQDLIEFELNFWQISVRAGEFSPAQPFLQVSKHDIVPVY